MWSSLKGELRRPETVQTGHPNRWKYAAAAFGAVAVIGGVAYAVSPELRNYINGLLRGSGNGTGTTTTTTTRQDLLAPEIRDFGYELLDVVNDKPKSLRVYFTADDQDPSLMLGLLTAGAVKYATSGKPDNPVSRPASRRDFLKVMAAAAGALGGGIAAKAITPVYASNIAEASLVVEPYIGNLPQAAFPQETKREFQLTPVDGSFDNKKEQFSQLVEKIKGGQQYRATATVKDATGKTTQQVLEVPYVREFENIAKKSGILTGITYHPWFENPVLPGHYDHWSELESNDRPLLGLYNSNNPLVVSKQIDWATGFGIHHFYCSYNAAAGSLADARLKTFLNNPLVKDMKFAILYETSMRFGGPPYETMGLSSANLNAPTTYSTLQNDFDRIAKNYFDNPSYLTINSQKVVYVYATGAILSDIVTPFTKLRQHLEDLGFHPFIIGDEIEIRWKEPIDSKRLQVFDAVSGYSLPPPGKKINRSPSAVRQEYARWQSAAHAVGVEIIPSVYPGYDDHYLVEIGKRPISFGYVPRSTEFFKANLEIAKEFIDKNNLFKIISWDEWGENSYIEPSVDDGFKYLQTLADTLVD